MSLANTTIDVLRDWKRIADQPPDQGGDRMSLWSTHARLRWASLTRGGHQAGEFNLLNWRVSHLGLGSLFHLYREIFVDRLYDVALGRKSPTIIDCGSNIGMSILRFKTRYPQANVIGFEPHPVVHEVLQRNVERNQLSSVVVHRLALGREAGSLAFFIRGDDPGALNMGFFADPSASQAIMVQSERLSNFIDAEVDLLKLDIEGAEEMVLQELAAADKLRQVRHIVCEYHHHLDSGIDRLSLTLATLEQAGFGYQIGAHAERPIGQPKYQDVVIYAYRKDSASAAAPWS